MSFEKDFEEIKKIMYTVEEMQEEAKEKKEDCCTSSKCEHRHAKLIDNVLRFITLYEKVKHNREFRRMANGEIKAICTRTYDFFKSFLEYRKKEKNRKKREKKQNKKKEISSQDHSQRESFIVSEDISSFDAGATYDFFKKRFARIENESSVVHFECT